MVETGITFSNKLDIKVQAQIFVGPTLISTCLVQPGATEMLSTTSKRYDIYLKNGATGWGLAHKLDIESTSLTLAVHSGRYTVR
jgi:hypothetical protein